MTAHLEWGSNEFTFNFGDQWCTKIFPKVQNIFWQNIINDWSSLIKIRTVKNVNQLTRSCVWYNSYISHSALFFPDWYNDIHLVGDVLNNDSKFITMQELDSKFNSNVNILNYYTIGAKVDKPVSKYKPHNYLNIERPTYPFHLLAQKMKAESFMRFSTTFVSRMKLPHQKQNGRTWYVTQIAT